MSTIKQLVSVENGRLIPSTKSVDADILEVSKASDNALEVREDGLYYKPRVEQEDLLALKTDVLGEVSSAYYTKGQIDSNYALLTTTELTNYYTKVATDTQITSAVDTYENTVASKKYLTDSSLSTALVNLASTYNQNGLISSPKIFIGTTIANSDGDWSIDYSIAGFSAPPIVVATGQSTGTALADRRFASISPNNPTRTGCVGKLASSSSAGLLAAMTMVAGAGTVSIIAIGV